LSRPRASARLTAEAAVNSFGKCALAVLAVLPIGCARPSISTKATDNPKIPYEVLFTREGCEVGRFVDYGRPVYVTLCPAAGRSASQSSHVEQCGKNCHHVVDTHQTQLRGEPGPAP
jgi:hypothetical protein